MKQETLEEVALNIIPDKSTAGWIDSFGATERIGFIKGAKWQQERMYSEEDMWKAYKQSNTIFEDEIALKAEFKEWFEKFKKK